MVTSTCVEILTTVRPVCADRRSDARLCGGDRGISLALMTLEFVEVVDAPLDRDHSCAGLCIVRGSGRAVARRTGRTIASRTGIDDVDGSARAERPRYVPVRRPRRPTGH